MLTIKKVIKKIIEKLLFSIFFIPVTLIFFFCKTSKLTKQNTWKKKYRILALNPDRFRGDLDKLNDTDSISIVTIPFNLQAWMINSFYDYPKSVSAFYQPEQKSSVFLSRVKCRNFLKLFLKWYYKILRIDCVISAAVHYKHDYDWGAVTHQLNIPYIVLHRENLLQCTPGGYAHVYELSQLMGTFEGSAIVTHNKKAADCFVDSSFANSNQVFSLGCMRMDDYLNKINESKEYA